MMWGYGFSWGGRTLMMLGMTLWIALVVVLAWALIRWLSSKTAPSVPLHCSTKILPNGSQTFEEQ